MGVDNSPGELVGYGPIPAPVARRIAADPGGTWRRMLTDPAGNLLDLSPAVIGPAGYSTSPSPSATRPAGSRAPRRPRSAAT